MPAETQNQESSSQLTSKQHLPIMQAEAGFQRGRTVFSTIVVLLSLDDDHYLRVYKQSDHANQASIPPEPYLEIAAADVTRAYASTPQIVIKTTARRYRFDLSGGVPDGAEFQPLLDKWLEALQQDQFPVKRSAFNDFMVNKILSHSFLSIMIVGVLSVVVLILIVCIVIFNGPGWFQDLRYFLFPQ